MMQRLRRRQFLHLGSAFALAACSSDPAAKKPEPDPDAGKPWWLRGNFKPVDESEATSLEVVGELPPSLDGLFVRNGPNPLSGESGHWFLGDGMVHGVRLDDGQAEWYRARYIQTDVLGVEDDGGLGPPGPTTHQANTAIVAHAGRLMCLEEIGLPYEIDPADLSTRGPYDFAGALSGAMTAHPKIDPVTGEMLFFGYNVLGPYLTYHVVDAQGTLTRSEVIDVPGAAMMHDFQVTATHVVFMFLPILFSLDLALAGDPFPFRWDPSAGARLGVMPRDGGNDDVEWFDIEPCYVFHTFNAFNDPADSNKVILDAVRYPELWVASSDDFDAVGQMWRWEMVLGEGVSGGPWDDTFAEFPRIDDRKQGVPYRYGYGVATSETSGVSEGVDPMDTIIKYDRQAGSAQKHILPDGLRAGEAVFVPDGDAEDDGYLLTFAYDGDSDRGELVVVDARDVAAEPVARVKLPARVPYGFHGIFLRDGG